METPESDVTTLDVKDQSFQGIPPSSIITINGKYKFSKALLLHSTMIQDMMADCKGELPLEIELPNMANDLSLEAIEELEKINRYRIANDLDDPDFQVYLNETLDIAILFDIRSLIPLIIFHRSNDKFLNYLEKPNVMIACIEHSHNRAYNVLRIILDSCSQKIIRHALYRIEDFSRYDKSSQIFFSIANYNDYQYSLSQTVKFLPIQINSDDYKKYHLPSDSVISKRFQHYKFPVKDGWMASIIPNAIAKWIDEIFIYANDVLIQYSVRACKLIKARKDVDYEDEEKIYILAPVSGNYYEYNFYNDT